MTIQLNISEIQFLTDVLEACSLAEYKNQPAPAGTPSDIRAAYAEHAATNITELCETISISLSNPVVNAILFRDAKPGQTFDIDLAPEQLSFLQAILPTHTPEPLRQKLTAL